MAPKAASKFDAAQAKAAAATPKPKAAAPKAAVVKAAPKVAMPATLKEKKAFVLKHEVKIDDADQNQKDEPNKAKQKELQNKLKNLKVDEIYVACMAEIKELEIQAQKDAERAALEGGDKKGDKKAAGGDKKGAKDAGSVATEKATDEIMVEINGALSDAGKDAAAAKEKAIKRLEGCAASTAFVLPVLHKLIPLFDNSKLGAPAIKAACAMVDQVYPKGHTVASVVVPLLMDGMSDKKWKIKAGCIEVMLPTLQQMEHTPAQLAQALPFLVPKLAEAALEVRAEIRNATAAVLREIGTLVASPEIKKLSQDLVTALAEPTNQKHTQAVLAKMGSQTFLSLIDPASLSLVMPVLVRGLRERDSASKKWSAQIFGATAMLVEDVDSIKPYLKAVVPLLKDALTDPVQEVQREAAKAFGTLEQVLPEYSKQFLQPYYFDRLRNGNIGEQKGASLALSEALLKMDKGLAAQLIPYVELAADHEKLTVRRGFLEFLECLPHAMKMDFVPYITKLFPKMLMGITGDKDKDEDAGLTCSTSLVARFGDLCPHLLLPSFTEVYAATLQGLTNEEVNRQQIIRDKACMLLGKLIDKVLEHKRFGQDLLTTEDCSNLETRTNVLVLLFMMRSDADASVKRYANGAWKAAGGAPKMQKAIMPAIEKFLARTKAGEFGLGFQKHGAKVAEELLKNGDIEAAPAGENGACEKYGFKTPDGIEPGSEASNIANGTLETSGDETGFKRLVSGDAEASELLRSHATFSKLPECVLTHCNDISFSVVKEALKKKAGGPKVAKIIAVELLAALEHDGDATAEIESVLPELSEALARAAMGDAFDAVGGYDDDCAETLLRVENLLLMYGGGKLLLKDTVLEMKKNCCYGVIGQNGAGKTTLMKEIANHRIVGMPQHLKCIHVDDSKLGLMSGSALTVSEYCMKMAKDINVETTAAICKEKLIEVGFKDASLKEPVNELSVGWRMRLTLTVNMMKHADLVLLDEPTNHLDEESVEWLGEYVKKITGSSVMVISHEPKFLDRICTHIMAYVDKKLEYTLGGFHNFAAKKGLTKEQIDAMLSGNLSFDTKGKKEGEEEEDELAEAPVTGPAKLSFPIPGSVEGVKSSTKGVLETKSISFRYSEDKDYLVHDCNVKLCLSSRIAICGRNGCGKSTLMTLLCSEMSATPGKDGKTGNVERHCNLRLAYMKQDHLKALGPFFDASTYVYISERFKAGYDGDLQKRLIEPENEEEGIRRANLAKLHGKYGKAVEDMISRTKMGSELAYEIQWEGMPDPKQNTVEKLSKLKMMGLEKAVIACDERIAAKAAGLDQRPLTRREIVRHVEAFGIDEEMCCNQQIKGFSAGQKVRLSLAAMFWTKPHLIAVDEPTNYLDVETVEALAKALNTFRGGIIMIEPKTDFVEKICNEKWHMEDGKVTVEKLANGAKRQA